MITRGVDPKTGEVQKEPAAKIRRNAKRDNGQSTITRHFAAARMGQPEAGGTTATAATHGAMAATAIPAAPEKASQGIQDTDVELVQVVPAAEG
jgi:hypothetical protein